MYRKEYMDEWRKKNKEKKRQHWINWYSKHGKEYNEKNRKRIKEKNKRWRDSEKGKAWTVDPLKWAARRAVINALRRGDLIRLPCSKCDKVGQAHHSDYAKPLDVQWLCRKHHYEVHQWNNL